MKIIQVNGLSNTGKTTFIKQLIPVLRKKGRVAVIKHLGDHDYLLEKGKDTTGFFEAGAEISAGIDKEKSVVALRDNSLDSLLALFQAQGMDYCIIEGFKNRSFKKIVIGDLQAEGCILRNPAVEDVVASVDRFDTY
ncbi:MAG: molybdopterin-guanine dinucleotide biosynthesis protein B [Methanoregula sp.]|jgi:molybdopterin-guanine dinucleotide biosynthesis protein MobB|nr:molybdopterin-guanine dinucleotide biosynthesis protein B [Methanoregula sp.]